MPGLGRPEPLRKLPNTLRKKHSTHERVNRVCEGNPLPGRHPLYLGGDT